MKPSPADKVVATRLGMIGVYIIYLPLCGARFLAMRIEDRRDAKRGLIEIRLSNLWFLNPKP